MGTPITMEILKGIVTWQGQNATSFINDGLCGNDIVYSIISLITNKAKVAPWSVYRVKDESKYKAYSGIMKDTRFITNWKAVQELKNEALEIYTGDEKLSELLKYPNEEDSWSDLIEGWGGFKLATGNNYTAAALIQAGINKGKPNSLSLLPAQYTSIIADIQQWPARALGYQLYIGVYYKYSREEVCHDKYFNPRADASGLQLYGMSPLQAAAKLLTRSNLAKDASVANLVNGGPAGILSFDMGGAATASGVVTGQVEAMKKRLLEFSGAKNKNKIAVSGYKADYKNIGLSNVDLDIINGEMWDMRSLCNVYGVPSQLLNDPENKAEANAKEAEKALTVRAAIPLLCSIEANLNRKLSTDWGYKGKNIVVGFDTGAYQELQEDKATMATWLQNTPLPIREKLTIMGLKIPDSMSDELLDSVYVGSNMQQLDEQPAVIDPSMDPYNEPPAPKKKP